MMKKIFLVIILAFFVSPAHAEVTRYSVPLDGSPYLGPVNAPVTIIEFIDYQ